MLGAIVIVGSEDAVSSLSSAETPEPVPLSMPTDRDRGSLLACVEVLGRSVLERVLDELRCASLDAIALLADDAYAKRVGIGQTLQNASFLLVKDVWAGAADALKKYRESGIESSLIIRVSAYAEFDLKEAVQSHGEQREVITRVFSDQTALDIWVVDIAGLNLSSDTPADLAATLYATPSAHYEVRGYVNHLEHPRDLRRLVVDSLSNRCRLRPQGLETRPGVWMEGGADVHRGARIVPPAFVGRGSKIGEQCLITRCSSVERDSEVDYGTIVEDSSILSNSYVGIGLDVSHAIVQGSTLLNLERGVALDIADPTLIRRNKSLSMEALRTSTLDSASGMSFFVSAEEHRNETVARREESDASSLGDVRF